jgi:hypothetical protein
MIEKTNKIRKKLNEDLKKYWWIPKTKKKIQIAEKITP